MKLSRLLAVVLVMGVMLTALNPVSAQDTSQQKPNLGVIVLPFSIPHNSGARVIWVVPDSPAAKAGIRPFDVIQAINGHTVTSRSFATELAKVEGETVSLSVLRKDTTLNVQATLTDQPMAKTSLQLNDQGLRGFLLETPLSHLMHDKLQESLQRSFVAPDTTPQIKWRWIGPFRLPMLNESQLTKEPIL